MTKKIFIQPELMVVCIDRTEVITTSFGFKGDYRNGLEDLAPDRRFDSWDEGY